ncbi:hypothetical protein FE36_19805 [Xanthomonas oryzae pv. oryzicola]|nr:hypothetical protein FE36_19805 [Xanthomonas oryzae pv. oryzicola]
MFVYPRSTIQMDLMQYVAISQDGRILELQFAGQNAPRRNLLFPLRLQLTGANACVGRAANTTPFGEIRPPATCGF